MVQDQPPAHPTMRILAKHQTARYEPSISNYSWQPAVRQTDAKGQEYAFALALTRVWNATVSRHSGRNVGYR